MRRQFPKDYEQYRALRYSDNESFTEYLRRIGRIDYNRREVGLKTSKGIIRNPPTQLDMANYPEGTIVPAYFQAGAGYKKEKRWVYRPVQWDDNYQPLGGPPPPPPPPPPPAPAAASA